MSHPVIEKFKFWEGKLFERSASLKQKYPVLILLFKIFLYSVLAVCLFYLVVFIYVYRQIPSRNELRYIQNSTASEIYTSDSVLIGRYYIQDRTNVTYEQISPNIIHALIATEDNRFYKHSGVDTKGMIRVLVKSIIMGEESSGGGSTISQQLAKNLFPRESFGVFTMPFNKLREAIIARKLEDVFSKEEILTLYLNTVPFGNNAFGIGSASKRYFNRSAKNIKVQEGAVLVGMLKAITTYNPKNHPERAKGRRNVVLEQMAKYNYLTRAEADSIKGLPMKIRFTNITHNEGKATYFREYLRQELQKYFKEHPKEDGTYYDLYSDGLKIYTTLNSKMQDYAERAVREHMAVLQKSFYGHWGKNRPWGKTNEVIILAMKRSKRYQLLKESGASEEEIKKIFNTPRKMKLFSYNGVIERTISPLDSIKYYQYILRAGFMAMNARNGNILAWVGGIDHNYFKYDHVNTNTKRQVGSTFKPIVYAAAIETGAQPCDYILNDKIIYPEYDNWSPRNSDGAYGGEYSMEGALTNSVNTVSAQLIMKAGINNVVNIAQKMGIESTLDPIPSLALGSADVSLFEMVGAYSTFVNNGYSVKPRYVLSVTNSRGQMIKNFEDDVSRKKALSPETSEMMLKMLQTVVNKGTASRLRTQHGIATDIAGKTGTTQSQADGWFIGFSPDIVAGVWVGAEDRRVHFRSLALGQGAAMALPIWGKFFSRVYKDKSFKKLKNAEFKKPSTYVVNAMDCIPYLAPDTLLDSLDEFDPFNSPKKVDEVLNDAVDKIWNLFKKKKKD